MFFYVLNLIAIFVCYVLIIIFNQHLLDVSNLINFGYGIIMILFMFLICIVALLIKNNIDISIKYAKIIGPIISIFSFCESFFPAGYAITNLNFLNLIILVFGFVLYYSANKICYSLELKHRDNLHGIYDASNKGGLDNFSNNLYSNDINNKKDCVVMGYINDVVYDDVTNNFFIEIVYEYNEDVYTFYVGKFDSDISNILDEKNLRNIEVFLQYNLPDLAQIDEDYLRYKLES